MRRRHAILLSVLIAAALPNAAAADACRRADTPSRAKAAGEDCRPEDRLVPYDPDAVRRGREAGFIDLGNGSEIRIGGRVRIDYDVRR